MVEVKAKPVTGPLEFICVFAAAVRAAFERNFPVTSAKFIAERGLQKLFKKVDVRV